MNQVGKFYAKELNVILQTNVQSLIKTEDSKWKLLDNKSQSLGLFDWVISTAPAKQTQELFPTYFSDYSNIQNTKMLGCFSLMVGFNKPLPLTWESALVKNSDISWIAINNSKPGRPKSFSMLVQTTNAWG